MIEAIQTILDGKRYINAELEAKLLNQVLYEIRTNDIRNYVGRLTERENVIFQLIGIGKSTKDIANTLNISIRTVDSHKENIKKKLNMLSMNDVLESAIKWAKVNTD